MAMHGFKDTYTFVFLNIYFISYSKIYQSRALEVVTKFPVGPGKISLCYRYLLYASVLTHTSNQYFITRGLLKGIILWR